MNQNQLGINHTNLLSSSEGVGDISLDSLAKVIARLSPVVSEGTWSVNQEEWLTLECIKAEVARIVSNQKRCPLAKVADILGVEAAYLRVRIPLLVTSLGLHWIQGDLASHAYMNQMQELWCDTIRQHHVHSLLDFCQENGLNFGDFEVYVSHMNHRAEGIVSLDMNPYFADEASVQSAKIILKQLLASLDGPQSLPSLQVQLNMPEPLFYHILRDDEILQFITNSKSGSGYLFSNAFIPHSYVATVKCDLLQVYQSTGILLLDTVSHYPLLSPGTLLDYLKVECKDGHWMQNAVVSRSVLSQFEASVSRIIADQGWVDAESIQLWPLHSNDLSCITRPRNDKRSIGHSRRAGKKQDEGASASDLVLCDFNMFLFKDDFLKEALHAILMSGSAELPPMTKEDVLPALADQYPSVPLRLLEYLVQRHYNHVSSVISEARNSVFFRPVVPASALTTSLVSQSYVKWKCHYHACQIFDDSSIRIKLMDHLLSCLGSEIISSLTSPTQSRIMVQQVVTSLSEALESSNPQQFDSLLNGIHDHALERVDVEILEFCQSRVAQYRRDLYSISDKVLMWQGERDPNSVLVDKLSVFLLLACLLDVYERSGQLVLLSGKFVPVVVKASLKGEMRPILPELKALFSLFMDMLKVSHSAGPIAGGKVTVDSVKKLVRFVVYHFNK